MNVCPVCEAPALARVCEVCGHAFAAAQEPIPLVTQLEDLDRPPESNGPVVVTPLFEMEPTRFAPADVPEAWSETEWERTATDAAPDVAAGGLAEMDRGREAPDVTHLPALSGPAICRYCRNVQASGSLCDRCGMALPRPMASAAAPKLQADSDALVRCRKCGERTYQRVQCAACGSLLTGDEAAQ